MQRDWLLGFPPVLLAQDDQMPCSDEGLHFPLGIPESAYHDYKSRPEYKRTRELMAFEMLPARPEITEADCRQVKPSADAWRVPSKTVADAALAASGSVTVCIYDIGSNEWEPAPKLHHYTPLVTDEASPVTVPQPAPPGVWRKTAEHKPPKVGMYMLRRPFMKEDAFERRWDGAGFLMAFGGQHFLNQDNTEWLDTSGEFKVGDRVRIGVSEHGAPARLCGAIGRVVQKIDDDFGVRVGGESRAWWYGPNELEHA